jgi:hypothetical protein
VSQGLVRLPFRLPALALLPLFFIACASGYHKAGLFGDGYSEEKLAPDRWLVTFEAGAFTPMERLEKYLLRRSAEITVANDARYFAVLSSAAGNFHPSGTRPNLIENPSWTSGGASDATTAQSASPKGLSRVVIQIFKGRPPPRLNAYEAREVLEKLAPPRQAS